MRTRIFALLAALGQTAHVARPWSPPYRGRIVGLSKPRYGAYVRDEGGVVRYTDCAWIVGLDSADGNVIAREQL